MGQKFKSNLASGTSGVLPVSSTNQIPQRTILPVSSTQNHSNSEKLIPFYPQATSAPSTDTLAPDSSTRRSYQKTSIKSKIAKLKESEYDSELRQALSGIKVQIQR